MSKTPCGSVPIGPLVDLGLLVLFLAALVALGGRALLSPRPMLLLYSPLSRSVIITPADHILTADDLQRALGSPKATVKNLNGTEDWEYLYQGQRGVTLALSVRILLGGVVDSYFVQHIPGQTKETRKENL